MKEAIVQTDLKVRIEDVEIPQINADQVLIRVVVSGSNPKDWKIPVWFNKEQNSGDDIAGYVEKVGDNVTEFKPGDRVAAFHEMLAPHGSFAEYAVAWAATTFHIPKKTSFEEAATIPLAAMTAALGLYRNLDLPEPWKATKIEKPIPLIVYGAASAVGAFAIKLARASNIHPIIAVASNTSFVETLIDRSKGDTIVNYRDGNEAVISGIKKALKDAGVDEVYHAYDAISEHGSYDNISQVLAEGGKLGVVLPPQGEIPKHVKWSRIMVGEAHGQNGPNTQHEDPAVAQAGKDLGFLFFRYFGRGLQEGWFTPHPYEVVPGGLNGVEQGLNNLKDGKASAVKYVFRIEETKA